MRNLLTILPVFMFMSHAAAEIVFKSVEYKQGDTVLEGLSVYDDAVVGKRPGSSAFMVA